MFRSKSYCLSLSAALLAALLPGAALAGEGGGHGPGNGGDAVVCRNADGAIRSAEALDVYEGREIYKRVPVMGGAALSTDEKVRIAIERLRQRVPELAKRLSKSLDEMRTEMTFLRGKELADISDSAHLYFPAGCKVEQVIVQRIGKPLYPGQTRYTVNADLWEALDSDNQAALKLHELLYPVAIEGGQKDSIQVRKFNSLLFSDQFLAMPIVALGEQLMDLMRAPFGPESTRAFAIHNGFSDPKDQASLDRILIRSSETERVGLVYAVGRWNGNDWLWAKDDGVLRYGACTWLYCWVGGGAKKGTDKEMTQLWKAGAYRTVLWLRPALLRIELVEVKGKIKALPGGMQSSLLWTIRLPEN